MAVRAQFELKIQGEQAPDSPYLSKVTTSNTIKQSFLEGVLDNTFDTLFKDDDAASGTIGTSATKAFDLQTALDSLGVAMLLTDVALIYIEHPADSLASSISVQAAGANGLTNLLAATANFTIPPGGFLLFYMPLADATVVSGTNKIIDVINDDGSNVAKYVIEVWGRK